MTQIPLDIETNELTHSIPSVPSEPFFRGTMLLPPSIDKAYQIIRYKGGMRIGPSAELEQFKRDAAMMLSQAEQDDSLIHAIRESKIKVPLEVKLRVYFQTMWKSDVDNRIKFAVDAAFTRIDLNDNLVVDLHVTKEVDQMDPRIEIEISVIVR